MDWLTFISKVVDAVVWPVLLFAVGYCFKDSVSRLIENIESVSHKDTKVNFGKKIEDAIENAENAGIHVASENDDIDMYSNKLSKVRDIASIDPSAAVLYIWGDLERAIADLGSYYMKDQCGHACRSFIDAERVLIENNVIRPSYRGALKELRYLKNKLSHGLSTEVTYDEAMMYTELAVGIKRDIDLIKEHIAS